MSTKLIAIEDDVASVMLLKRFINRAEWDPEFIHFMYGTDALAFLADNKSMDIVVLLDLNLPDMSGIDILREIRENPRYKDLPVVVLTTSNLEYEKSVCQSLGVERFLEKPFNFERLISLLSKLNVGTITP